MVCNGDDKNSNIPDFSLKIYNDKKFLIRKRYIYKQKNCPIEDKNKKTLKTKKKAVKNVQASYFMLHQQQHHTMREATKRNENMKLKSRKKKKDKKLCWKMLRRKIY